MTKLSARQEERVISSRASWFDVDLAGVWHYRSLLWQFVKRDFVAMYKQTLLGPLWYVIQPVVSALVFSIIFGRIANLPTDGVPPFLFYLASMVCWGYFSSCISATSTTFSINQGLFGKVYFPRLVVPIATVITNLISFAVQLGMFLAFLAWYMSTGASAHPTAYLLLTPLLLAQMAALGLGVGLVVTAFTTRYRDLAMAVSLGVSLWMYATPIIYPFSAVPERYQVYLVLNPMTGVVEMFRQGFLGAGTLSLAQYGVSLLVTALVLAVGVIVFARFEKSFIDTI